MEDIVTVIDGRATLLDEIKTRSGTREYLVTEFSAGGNPRFIEAPADTCPATREVSNICRDCGLGSRLARATTEEEPTQRHI